MSSSIISNWNSRFWFIALLLLVPALAVAQSPVDVFTAALNQHGGAAVDSVATIHIDGQSTDRNGTLPVAITAELDGHIRFDYGKPVVRSLVHTPQYEFIVRGSQVEHKQQHVELFATLDMLSIFGLRRIETGAPAWSDGGTAVDGGRTVIIRGVSTGQQRRIYGRFLKDNFQIAFDAQTGLVSSITRQQYSDNSLDVVFPVTYRFSDYRKVENVVFPFRIEKSVLSQITETIVVSAVQLNPPVSGSTFER
jgi:hypothetical protein